jgi:transcriptional regulator with XRE-family HTH domain
MKRETKTSVWNRGFGRRLRETRIALGLSEEQAAKQAGRSVKAWRKYEETGSGRLTPAVIRFAKANKDKINFSYLFSGPIIEADHD